MTKKIALILFLLLTISACSDDKADKNSTSNTSTLASPLKNTQVQTNNPVIPDNGNGEEVELTEEDILAMNLLNDEIFADECKAYAQEDSVDNNNLDAYMSDCVEQLKLRASVIVDSQDEEQQTEATPPTTSVTPSTPKL